MAISDRNINFRAPEATHDKIAQLKQKFECSRTWILIKAIDHFFALVFMPWILREVFDEWEAFSRKMVQHTAIQPKQLRLVFGEPLPPFYPRFGGIGADARPKPVEAGPVKAVGVVRATGAYTSPRFSASVRLLFGQVSTRRVA